jgi:hypothetical protein
MAEAWRAHLRIAILRALNDDPGKAGNESLLVDLDQVRDELLWLHERNLVQANVVRGSMVALLTERGAMVAEGKRTEEGVKRPNVTAQLARKALKISLDDLKY